MLRSPIATSSFHLPSSLSERGFSAEALLAPSCLVYSSTRGRSLSRALSNPLPKYNLPSRRMYTDARSSSTGSRLSSVFPARRSVAISIRRSPAFSTFTVPLANNRTFPSKSADLNISLSSLISRVVLLRCPSLLLRSPVHLPCRLFSAGEMSAAPASAAPITNTPQIAFIIIAPVSTGLPQRPWFVNLNRSGQVTALIEPQQELKYRCENARRRHDPRRRT